jgi:hypothetical protein
MNNPQGVELIDVEGRYRVEEDRIVRKLTQEIPDSFLRDIADERHAAQHVATGNFLKVASIPTAVAEQWLAEGFNIYDQNVGVREILKRLNSQDMQKFIATDKRI